MSTSSALNSTLPNSSPLALFSGRPKLSSTAPPTLRAFVEARCEITAEDPPGIINLDIAGSALAVQGVGGSRNRDPTLRLYNLDRENFSRSIWVGVGLAHVAYHMQLDGSRDLVYVADGARIKSYRWRFDAEDRKEVLAVHTLRSSGYSGALALRADGAQFMRAGSKGIAIWDMETQPTHGDRGDEIIGRVLDVEALDTWRNNEGEEIELSSGSRPTQQVAAPALARIDKWTGSPGDGREMLVSYKNQGGASRVDLETHQVVGHYTAHRGQVSDIRTSSGDAHSFLTATDDGTVRLYDVRVPAPVLSAEHGEGVIYSALYEHIGGRPFIIIGGTQTQQVSIWDVRMQRPLYELSTGNNEVNALAWDAPRQSLYAGTECPYIDHIGNHHGYRKVYFFKEHDSQATAKGKAQGEGEDEGADDKDDEDDEDDEEEDEEEDEAEAEEDEAEAEEDEEEDEDDDEDNEDWEVRRWPQDAYHSERAFQHFLDSADHRIYRYCYKIDADVNIVPKSGYSSPYDNYAGW